MFFFLHRETDWLFGSNEGRRQLADDAKFQRLLIIHLGRDHQFANLDCVQTELGGVVSSLQPEGLPPSTQVFIGYFLSILKTVYIISFLL